MANQYIVTEHNVTPGTCRVMAQLKLSDMPGRDNTDNKYPAYIT